MSMRLTVAMAWMAVAPAMASTSPLHSFSDYAIRPNNTNLIEGLVFYGTDGNGTYATNPVTGERYVLGAQGIAYRTRRAEDIAFATEAIYERMEPIFRLRVAPVVEGDAVSGYTNAPLDVSATDCLDGQFDRQRLAGIFNLAKTLVEPTSLDQWSPYKAMLSKEMQYHEYLYDADDFPERGGIFAMPPGLKDVGFGAVPQIGALKNAYENLAIIGMRAAVGGLALCQWSTGIVHDVDGPYRYYWGADVETGEINTMDSDATPHIYPNDFIKGPGVRIGIADGDELSLYAKMEESVVYPVMATNEEVHLYTTIVAEDDRFISVPVLERTNLVFVTTNFLIKARNDLGDVTNVVAVSSEHEILVNDDFTEITNNVSVVTNELVEATNEFGVATNNIKIAQHIAGLVGIFTNEIYGVTNKTDLFGYKYIISVNGGEERVEKSIPVHDKAEVFVGVDLGAINFFRKSGGVYVYFKPWVGGGLTNWMNRTYFPMKSGRTRCWQYDSFASDPYGGTVLAYVPSGPTDVQAWTSPKAWLEFDFEMEWKRDELREVSGPDEWGESFTDWITSYNGKRAGRGCVWIGESSQVNIESSWMGNGFAGRKLMISLGSVANRFFSSKRLFGDLEEWMAYPFNGDGTGFRKEVHPLYLKDEVDGLFASGFETINDDIAPAVRTVKIELSYKIRPKAIILTEGIGGRTDLPAFGQKRAEWMATWPAQ